MVDSRAPGVIVVAERSLYDLLVDQAVDWRVQDRVESVAAMWDGLSSGALDPYSRVVVFSDSLGEDDPDELTQTAWAVAAMAGAGARVFVAVWQRERAETLDRQIVDAATAQGLDATRLEYHALAAFEPARAVLDTLRDVLGPDIAFPDHWNGSVDQPLRRRPDVGLPLRPPARPTGLPVAPPQPHRYEPEPRQEEHRYEPEPLHDEARHEEHRYEPEPRHDEHRHEPEPPHEEHRHEPGPPHDEPPHEEPRTFVREVILDEGWLRPGLPPITDPVPSADSWSDEHPPQASRSLLERPVLPSQVTIAVTSSKGGSGKTTVSVMLAATVARASSAVGRRLSVVVVDLDTYHGQVSSLVGTFMPTALNIRVQPDWDEDCIRRSIVSDPGLDIDVLLAPVRPRTADIVGPTFYRSIVQSLKRMYDVVILDTGNHYLDPLVADVALVEADAVLFVTTLASTSVQGMARALRELTDSSAEAGLGVPPDSIGIVVNQAAGGVGSDSDTLVTAGLGIPIVGVIPLATRDVLRATNASRMADLLDHPLLGPAYTDLARACLPNRALAPWRTPEFAGAHAHPDEPAGGDDHGADGPERRGLFRR